ncbi:MAG TPA: flavin reductase family protein [Rhizomicrobium sp.]|jgi:flavin reductase (DIM6/NTAB) family NADH-FMN oxidoreductase RutF
MADPVTPPDMLTPAQWRAAMGAFPSGVTIVTSWQDGQPIGTTISAFCSVSLEPPLLLVCMDYKNPALAPIEDCKVFGVNILGRDSGPLAMLFGKDPNADRFAGVDYRVRAGGAPQLSDAPVFIDCALEHSYEAGDHKIFVGRGIHIEHAHPTAPLLYHKGAFPTFEPR